MAFKVLIFCVSALLVQSISGQCLRDATIIADGYGLAGTGLVNAGLAADGIGLAGQGLGWGWEAGLGGAVVGAHFANGGALSISSMSPIAPTGLSLLSENVIEGPLAISGSLPFLGTVAMDGALPTDGSGAISCGCGNGIVGIQGAIGGIANGLGFVDGLGYVDGIGLSADHFGYDAGIGYVDGRGLGAGRIGYNAGVDLARGCGYDGMLY